MGTARGSSTASRGPGTCFPGVREPLPVAAEAKGGLGKTLAVAVTHRKIDGGDAGLAA
jgi:hypothetical protein